MSDRTVHLNVDAMASLCRACHNSDTGADILGVFSFLVGALDVGNVIRMSNEDIADALGMPRYHVDRALQRLIERNIIHRRCPEGRMPFYVLSPYVGWRGSVDDHRVAIELAESIERDLTQAEDGFKPLP